MPGGRPFHKKWLKIWYDCWLPADSVGNVQLFPRKELIPTALPMLSFCRAIPGHGRHWLLLQGLVREEGRGVDEGNLWLPADSVGNVLLFSRKEWIPTALPMLSFCRTIPRSRKVTWEWLSVVKMGRGGGGLMQSSDRGKTVVWLVRFALVWGGVVYFFPLLFCPS